MRQISLPTVLITRKISPLLGGVPSPARRGGSIPTLFMVEIIVNLEKNGYPIKIGKGIVAEENFKKFGCDKCAIITDSNVEKLYAKDLEKKLNQDGVISEIFSFPAGETSKTFATVISLGRKMIKSGFGRNSLIIALGGGVVGDIAGFLASIYERGIKFVQIPTTLLAQVDSSIGGKTGVDTPEGKNLLGTFYQPQDRNM